MSLFCRSRIDAGCLGMGTARTRARGVPHALLRCTISSDTPISKCQCDWGGRMYVRILRTMSKQHYFFKLIPPRPTFKQMELGATT